MTNGFNLSPRLEWCKKCIQIALRETQTARPAYAIHPIRKDAL